MKSATRALLRFLYAVKHRCFPQVCLERIFPAWHSIHRRLILRSKSDFVENVLGHKMRLDDQDSLQLSINGIYEPFETRFLMQQIRQGQVVVDVGANIGYYTLQFCRQVGARGKVYAFEPAPDNFSLLKENVEMNGYGNATLVHAAVCEFSGTLKLYYNPAHKADHRIYSSGDQRESFDVQAVRLDDYFSTLDQPVDFLKMDIQGAEYRALLGMRNLLARNPHVVLVTEFWPFGLTQSGAKPGEYLELLSLLGFELFEIDEAIQGTRAVTPSNLLKETGHRSTDYANLMCKRPSTSGH